MQFKTNKFEHEEVSVQSLNLDAQVYLICKSPNILLSFIKGQTGNQAAYGYGYDGGYGGGYGYAAYANIYGNECELEQTKPEHTSKYKTPHGKG